MKNLVSATVVLFGLLILTGVLFVYLNWLSTENFIVFAGLIGTVASVISLIGLRNSSIDLKKLKEDEILALNKATEAFGDLRNLEVKLEKTKTDITELEARRAAIEAIARKTALKIFLEEKIIKIESEISERIKLDSRMFSLVEELESTKNTIMSVDTDLLKESPSDVKIITDVMRENRSRVQFSVEIDDPISAVFFVINRMSAYIIRLSSKKMF